MVQNTGVQVCYLSFMINEISTRLITGGRAHRKWVKRGGRGGGSGLSASPSKCSERYEVAAGAPFGRCGSVTCIRPASSYQTQTPKVNKGFSSRKQALILQRRARWWFQRVDTAERKQSGCKHLRLCGRPSVIFGKACVQNAGICCIKLGEGNLSRPLQVEANRWWLPRQWRWWWFHC